MIDYAELKKVNAEGFSQITSFKITPITEVIRILSDAQALDTYSVEQAITLKNGQKMKYDKVSSTFLFTKINGGWKATYYHESGSTPVEVK